jgi:hypothetical protein
VSTLIELESACNRLIAENENLKRGSKALRESLLETTKHLQNEWEDHLRPFCHDDFSQLARDVVNRACKAIAETEAK